MDGSLVSFLKMILEALTEWETLAVGTLQVIFDQVGWLGVTGFMVVETSTGIGSSEIILGLAGWLLLATHDLPVGSVLAGGLYAALGTVAGGSVQYWAARLGGRPLVDRINRLLRLNPRYIERVESALQRRGAWAVTAGRLIPFVRSVISVVAGLGRVPYPKFAAATFVGGYIYSTILVAIGYFLGHRLANHGWLAEITRLFSWENLGEKVPLWVLLAAAAALVALGAWLTWRGIRRLWQREAHEG